MNDDASNPFELASPSTIPPTTSSYWVVPGRLLAGAYPGDSDPEAHRAKVQALVDAGIRTFVNLTQTAAVREGMAGRSSDSGTIQACRRPSELEYKSAVHLLLAFRDRLPCKKQQARPRSR
jgi:hypothetical protein